MVESGENGSTCFNRSLASGDFDRRVRSEKRWLVDCGGAHATFREERISCSSAISNEKKTNKAEQLYEIYSMSGPCLGF
jgi:hypothetical protein